jgi:predicted nucleic acid-binding protein
MSRSRIPIPSRLFADTSAYFVLYSLDDAFHARAVMVATNGRRRLFTTNYVVAETHALLLRRLGRSVAIQFLKDIDQSPSVIARVRLSDDERARAIIFAQKDKDYSLTDATSFAVMERLHIGTAFTFDRHFAQYGFTVLGPDDP